MLAVWLPLTGNLNNQGVYPITVTSGTATYVTGKIGQGLDLSKRINFNCSALAGCKKFSVAFWVMIEDNENIISNWQDIIGFIDQKSDNSASGQLRAETCYATNQGPSNFGVHWHDNATYAMSTGNLIKHYAGDRGVWHHCVMTIDSEGKMGGYVDGNFIAEYATNNPGGHLTGVFWIGDTNNIAGGINDVRIYKNQILTSEEVKKLSQGLVLHLPLSRKGFGQDNLIPNGSNFSLWSKEGTSSVTLEEDGWYHIQSTNTNTSRYGCYYNLTFPEVGTYTLSAMVKTDWHIGFQALSAFNWTGQTVYGTGAERIVSYTVTTTEENNKCRIYVFGQNTVNSTYIKWIKVEKGDKVTPWTPNSSDALYTKMGLDDNIHKDISGYQHNVTLNNITYLIDSPINEICSVFNGSNSYVKVDDNTWMVNGATEITINYWAYSSNWNSYYTRMFSCTDSGGFNNEQGNSGYTRFPRYVYTNAEHTTKTYQYSNTGIKLADLTAGWHMFTFIYTTDGEKIYVDGNLYSEASFTSYGLCFNKSTRLFLGCEASGVNPQSPYFNGRMSDFRIYYTALSEDDVKDLYEKRG